MFDLTALTKDYLHLILLLFFLLFLLFFVWNIFLQIQLRKSKKRHQEIFSGKKITNLEDILLDQARNLKLLDKDIQELYNISNQINNLALNSFHKSGMVRFNPFKDVGGNQSFSLALLDGKDNGFTISSLFTREGARVYCKSIINGESEKHPLTEEEKSALKIAIHSKSQHKKNKNG